MPELLPRFYRRELARRDAAKVAAIVRETGELPEPEIVNGASGGDPIRMRGLPVVARGVRGAAPGSDPVAELLRSERRGRRGR